MSKAYHLQITGFGFSSTKSFPSFQNSSFSIFAMISQVPTSFCSCHFNKMLECKTSRHQHYQGVVTRKSFHRQAAAESVTGAGYQFLNSVMGL